MGDYQNSGNGDSRHRRPMGEGNADDGQGGRKRRRGRRGGRRNRRRNETQNEGQVGLINSEDDSVIIEIDADGPETLDGEIVSEFMVDAPKVLYEDIDDDGDVELIDDQAVIESIDINDDYEDDEEEDDDDHEEIEDDDLDEDDDDLEHAAPSRSTPGAPPARRDRFEISDNPQSDGRKRRQEMLINAADSDECRIALVTDNRLDELYIERAASASHVGNIYKGRVTNVEPSIQAAFVDFGLPNHGFLHISDVHPEYFPGGRESELVGRKTPRRERPPIQKCLRRGQEVIVQITKEGIGTKGPTLTTYLSIPGRFLVLMPGMEQLGVSRKVEDDDARRRARQTLAQLDHPKDMGFIVRTAGVDRNKRELEQDMNYLLRLWRVVQRRIKSQKAPCELYQESDLVIRTVRDVYSSKIERIIVDEEPTARKVAEFLAVANPQGSDVVVCYNGSQPLFHLYGIEAEIESLHSRHVPLACGGSIVIEPTEALVAIDVNSGRFRVQNDAEETARRVNLEAAVEITRQLRLRDLGGLIICDFIDMLQEKHRREVERVLRDSLKNHKERAKILRMSQFGIIEMTRQRQGPSISRSMFRDCPHCKGRGLVKSVESVTLDVLRMIQLLAYRDEMATIQVKLSPPVAEYLLNHKRRTLTALEHETGRTIVVTAIENYGLDQVEYTCQDARGRDASIPALVEANVSGRGESHYRRDTRRNEPRREQRPAADSGRTEQRSDSGRSGGGRGDSSRGGSGRGESSRGGSSSRSESPRSDAPQSYRDGSRSDSSSSGDRQDRPSIGERSRGNQERSGQDRGGRRDEATPARDSGDNRGRSRNDSRGGSRDSSRSDQRGNTASDRPQESRAEPRDEASHGSAPQDRNNRGQQRRGRRDDAPPAEERETAAPSRGPVRNAAPPSEPTTDFTAGLELDFDEIESREEPPLVATPDPIVRKPQPAARRQPGFSDGVEIETSKPVKEGKVIAIKPRTANLASGRTTVGSGDRKKIAASFNDGIEFLEAESDTGGSAKKKAAKKKTVKKAAAKKKVKTAPKPAAKKKSAKK